MLTNISPEKNNVHKQKSSNVEMENDIEIVKNSSIGRMRERGIRMSISRAQLMIWGSKPLNNTQKTRTLDRRLHLRIALFSTQVEVGITLNPYIPAELRRDFPSSRNNWGRLYSPAQLFCERFLSI
jgi:hypothetical protein